VRFWDASALIPLLRNESATPSVDALMRSDEVVAVWWGTKVECTSAIARAERAGAPADVVRLANRRLRRLASAWLELPPSESIRRDACRLLRIHDLRAADAMQLAAAQGLCRDLPDAFPFVSCDRRLGLAAEREGFDVIDPLAAE